MAEKMKTHQLRNRKANWFAWFLWVFIIFLVVTTLSLLQLNRIVLGMEPLSEFFLGIAQALSFGTVGLLIIVNRPRLPFGWLFMVLALASASGGFAEMYAIYGLITLAPEVLPGVRWMAWLQGWVLNLAFPAPIALACMLFPEGHLLSKRWRLAAWLTVFSIALLIFNEITSTGPVYIHITEPPVRLPINNPTGIFLSGQTRFVLESVWFITFISLPIGLFSLILRARKAIGQERQQLKWLGFFGGVILALLPIGILAKDILGDNGNTLLLGAVIFLLPTGTAISILRYRLYEIDIIIRKTLQYAMLTGLLALVYFGSVVLLQSFAENLTGAQSPVVIVFSTLAIAALFIPLRHRVQDFIDRRFFRRKYDAEKALSQFANIARDEVDMVTLTNKLIFVIEETLQPEEINLWLKK